MKARSARANQLLVFIDTSASMAGYVSPTGDTAYGQTLRSLRDAASIAATPMRVETRHVDAAVGPPQDASELSHAAIDRSLYRGTETNLPLALAEAEKTPGLETSSVVVITDGVQSTTEATEGCVAGSDDLCFREAFIRLSKLKGMSTAVLGVRSEFSGVVYSESLRSLQKPTSVAYRSTPGEVESYRPFVVYMLAPTEADLRVLMDTLTRNLSELPVGSLAALALGERPSAAGKGGLAEPPQVKEAGIAEGRERRVRIETGLSTAQGPYRYTIRVPAKGPPSTVVTTLKVQLPEFLTLGVSPEDTQRLISWRFAPLATRGSGSGAEPTIRVARSVASEDYFEVSAEIAFEKKINPVWRLFELQGRIEPDTSSPQWIETWSTEDDSTVQSGSRIYRLKTSLLGLWKHAQPGGATVARVFFRIGPN